MIGGGTHSMIHPFGVTGFNRLTALCEDAKLKPRSAATTLTWRQPAVRQATASGSSSARGPAS